jgi:predicted nuclease of predicted toxin-antitoxin system
VKLLIDMNLSPRWVQFFAGADIDAVHWSSVGAHDAPDSKIMEFARINDYVVLTHDLDFGEILAASNGAKPSVIQLRSNNVSVERIGPIVASAVKQLASELADGALVTIDTERTRIRLLPLRRL